VIGILRLLAVLVFAVSATPAELLAQTADPQAAAGNGATTAPDYEAWAATARRAEDAIEAARASDAAFEQLRTELVDWRARFLSAQDVNEARISTLQDQIAALGDPPAEGETEPTELSERRSELNDQLARLQAPVRTAEEAHTRADGLIGEIDAIIRERQTDELMQLGPSPLNPKHWSEGASAIITTGGDIAYESIAAWQNPIHRNEFQGNLPTVLFFLAVAAVLLMRGRHWMEQATIRVARGASSRGWAVFTSLISLGQVLLPLLGLVSLVAAIQATGLLGLRGGRLVSALPAFGLVILISGWLGSRIFPRPEVREPMFELAPEQNAHGRWLSWSLGTVVAVAQLLGDIAGFETYSEQATVTLSFPVLVVAGLFLLAMGRLLMRHVRTGAEHGDQKPFRTRLVRLVARGIMVIAVAGPGLAAVGYTTAANFFTYPAIETLGLLAFLAVLQRFVTDIYGAITGDAESAADALIPVLAGFVMSLLVLPVLALIWGARVADLTELWTRFTEGFSIGGTRISPVDILTFVIIFALGYMLTRLLQGALRSSILPKTKIDPGGQNAIISGIGYVGIFLAAIIAITATGLDLSSIAIVAGALSVGIGFGLQNIVSNFISGIILLVERPISEGDWIEVGGNMGIVRRISVRSTRIETFDRTDVIVPNADFVSGTVTNWTRNNTIGRATIEVGVAYGTDTRKVERILKELAMEHPLVSLDPEPGVDFMGFGADSLDFRIRAILKDVNFLLSVKTELNHRIAERFTEEGIEIPFAQRDIWLRNPEALRAAPPPHAPEAPTAPRSERDEEAVEGSSDPDD